VYSALSRSKKTSSLPFPHGEMEERFKEQFFPINEPEGCTSCLLQENR
jgi:hypothetical protein